MVKGGCSSQSPADVCESGCTVRATWAYLATRAVFRRSTPLLHRSSTRSPCRHPDKNKDNAEEATEKFKLVLASKNRLLQARPLQDPPAEISVCSVPKLCRAGRSLFVSISPYSRTGLGGAHAPQQPLLILTSPAAGKHFAS